MNMKGYLALLITVGFLAIVTGLSLGTFSTVDSPAILILFGTLSSGFGAVVSYYFGSAETSARAPQRKADEERVIATSERS